MFHAECLSAMLPCPKCERRRKREDLPIFDENPRTTDAVEEFVSADIKKCSTDD